MDNNSQNSTIRLSVSEAAKLFGVSQKTIRQAVKNQEIRYVVVRGRYRLAFDSLLKWSQASTRRRNQLATTGVGKFVQSWKISNPKFSPRPPQV